MKSYKEGNKMKKMLLLASMALAAAALAAPAGASASGMFFDEGNPILGEPHADFEGTIGFELSEGNTFECDAFATVALETNQGRLVELELDTESCVGAGVLEGCVLEDDELTQEASLTPTATDIDLSGLVLYNTLGGECPLPHEIEITDDPADLVTLVPDDHNAIGSLTVEGSVVVDGKIGGTYMPIATVTAYGSLNALGTDSGTYGLTEG